MNFRLVAQAITTARNSLSGRVHDICRLYGLETLGSGCFGAAYLHKATGLVLKVSFTKRDGTMGFMSKCAEHWRKRGRAPKHCPEVYEFGVLQECWYSVMEYVYAGEWNSGIASREEVQIAIANVVGGVRNMLSIDSFDYRTYSKATGSATDQLWDLHGGNYGMSKDGSRLCVFDPFGNGTRIRTFSKAVRAKVQHGPSQGRWAWACTRR